MSKNNDKKLMDKKSPKRFSTMFGWWVDLGVSGKIKCAVLGRLVKGKTALLILRSVGIFLFVSCWSCPSFRVSANGFGLDEGGDFEALHCQPSTNLDRWKKR